MGMRVIGSLLIVGILFSYVPVFPMDDCQGGEHMGNMNTNCGFIFHCPLVINESMADSLSLPLSGRLVIAAISPKVNELAYPVFHPPKYV
jgi:hypothetical protein